MALAAQTGLPGLLADKVHIAEPRIKSGSANPAPKLATLIAGMCAGADSIDDVDLVRCGGMKTLFDAVYAPSTMEPCCASSVSGMAANSNPMRHHLVAICGHVELLPGADQRAFVDIDSLLRPVYGQAKQGASTGTPRSPGSRSCAKVSRRW